MRSSDTACRVAFGPRIGYDDYCDFLGVSSLNGFVDGHCRRAYRRGGVVDRPKAFYRRRPVVHTRAGCDGKMKEKREQRLREPGELLHAAVGYARSGEINGEVPDFMPAVAAG